MNYKHAIFGLRLGLGLGLGLASIMGCGEDCPRSLRVDLAYEGTRSGVVYDREIWLPTGRVRSSAGGGPPAQGPWGPNFILGACWEAVAAADEPGYALEAWIDTDGDDANACGVNLADRVRCGPDTGEPQVLQEFTVRARGETRVSVVIAD